MAESTQADEKPPNVSSQFSKVNELDEITGVIVVSKEGFSSDEEANGSRSGLKAYDNDKILVPQPSDDPSDPLNWSWLKKHTVFLALIPGCFLTGMSNAPIILAQF
jgi:hypothetical protein